MTDRTSLAMEFLCTHRNSWRLIFVGSCLGAVLNVVSMQYVNQPSPTHVIVQLNMIGLIGLVGVSGGVLWKCQQRSW